MCQARGRGWSAALRAARMTGAVVATAVVGLTWWSLAGPVAVSIVVGQLLRPGPHLVEVPISAMLVRGVGAGSAETVGGGRVVETLIGAAVGMLVIVVFPPAVETRLAHAEVVAELEAFGRAPAPAAAAGSSAAGTAGKRWSNPGRVSPGTSSAPPSVPLPGSGIR